MEDLLAARAQMGMSLAFHIIFACVGIAMPLLMVIAEICWLKTGKEVYLTLAKRWSKGTAIMFAVGAVSGTVLSFELGLLWPGFMGWAGPIIGMPFSLEGFAFFTEAIFLGIVLYGWQRVSASMHIFAGIVVALSGCLSAIFVVIANAWMNTPVGFRMMNGVPVDIDPIAAMFNPNAFPQVLHMVIAAYASTAFMVAGIHAYAVLKQNGNEFHRAALTIALAVASISSLVAPLSGDVLAKAVAHNQPVKLAALEGQFKTETAAPLRIGGLPDVAARTTRFAIEIPGGLSFLAFDDPKAKVLGLDAVPERDWPPVVPVHISFQVMVALGSLLAMLSVWAIWRLIKRDPFYLHPYFLWAVMICSPLGFVCVEAGWMVTELGRQPWVIYNILRTADAVTSVPNLFVPFITFTFLYLVLAVIVVWLLIRQVTDSPYVARQSQ